MATSCIAALEAVSFCTFQGLGRTFLTFHCSFPHEQVCGGCLHPVWSQCCALVSSDHRLRQQLVICTNVVQICLCLVCASKQSNESKSLIVKCKMCVISMDDNLKSAKVMKTLGKRHKFYIKTSNSAN